MKIFISLMFALLFPVLCSTNLYAIPVTIKFSGQIDGVCNFPPFCNGFGLGISVGDPFKGSFSYDSNAVPIATNFNKATYALTNFGVNFPTLSFIATNPTMRISLFDGHIEWLNVQGSIPGGLFMNVGLTNGFPVLADLSLPTSLSCADWLLCGFQIKDYSFPAIEVGWQETNAIRALTVRNGSENSFSLLEPSTLLLLLSGLLGLIVIRKQDPV
jgi:hypothetical protein